MIDCIIMLLFSLGFFVNCFILNVSILILILFFMQDVNHELERKMFHPLNANAIYESSESRMPRRYICLPMVSYQDDIYVIYQNKLYIFSVVVSSCKYSCFGFIIFLPKSNVHP